MKVLELLNSIDVIAKLKKEQFPALVSWELSLFFQEANKYVVAFSEQRQKFISENTDGNVAALGEYLKPILESEIETKIPQIDISSLKQEYSTDEMFKINYLIKK